MNGYGYDDSVMSDATEDCETFLENYSRGNVDVGGIYPPEAAKLELPIQIVGSGHFPPPAPPDEEQRVRELYVPFS
jgi:hypothetical protein